jgi:hypothetical protein
MVIIRRSLGWRRSGPESIRTELGRAEDLVRELLGDETLGDQTELLDALLRPPGFT